VGAVLLYVVILPWCGAYLVISLVLVFIGDIPSLFICRLCLLVVCLRAVSSVFVVYFVWLVGVGVLRPCGVCHFLLVYQKTSSMTKVVSKLSTFRGI
jgi:hypothetical protein